MLVHVFPYLALGTGASIKFCLVHWFVCLCLMSCTKVITLVVVYHIQLKTTVMTHVTVPVKGKLTVTQNLIDSTRNLKIFEEKSWSRVFRVLR